MENVFTTLNSPKLIIAIIDGESSVIKGKGFFLLSQSRKKGREKEFSEFSYQTQFRFICFLGTHRLSFPANWHNDSQCSFTWNGKDSTRSSININHAVLWNSIKFIAWSFQFVKIAFLRRSLARCFKVITWIELCKENMCMKTLDVSRT